ncbi:MAG: putative Ice-binding-like adhesive domain [Verrucomicrobiota bacterium]
MKITVSRKAKELGTALFVALCISAFLCISITGYLSVTEQQNFLSARSQAWNTAIAVTEAGIEEGLQQLNSNSATTLACDGWAYDSGSTCYWRSNNMGNGNSYVVYIYYTNSISPILIARAFTAPPTFAQNNSGTFFAAVGVDVGSSKVTRAVKVTCSRPNIFSAVLVAKHSIDLQGNNVYSDSYDSSNPCKSLNGSYKASLYSGDKGDMATNGGVEDSIGAGNANIYGKIHTGPNCPVTIGSQGGVGPHGNQTSSVSTATANGWVVPDANFTFPDTTFPNTSGYLPLPLGCPCPRTTTSYTYTGNPITGAPTYPNPVPPWGGVVTNNNPATVNTYPSPVPPGLTTNAPVQVTSSTLPNPVVAGTVTNLTTTYTTGNGYPPAGQYVGGVTTNWDGNSSHLKQYSYYLITGRTYTYNTYTYSYPVYTYNYSTWTTNTIYTTNTYDYILAAGGNYSAASLSGKKVLIDGANVTLALANGMDGTENFTWNSGATLLIYSGDADNSHSITISGLNYINPNGSAGSLIIYAAPTVTSITLNGNGQFTGVLIAPYANLTLNGGGSSNEDFCGSVMVNSATLNGHFSFHYDEHLSSGDTTGRYLVKSWNEIP